MRMPTAIERLYVDFDGFFAAVEEQAKPALRGRPIGIVPFADSDYTICIAANARAKTYGVKTGTPVREARRLCPEIALVPQSPDLYACAHRKILNIIDSVLPIDAVCSIDELTCRLDHRMRADPHGVASSIKQRIAGEIGRYVTCSIGFASNRLIAKVACKLDKPDGVTIIAPQDLPGRLLTVGFDAIPGIGSRMAERLATAGIHTMADLWATQPKQLRAIWGNVTGERMWYALHGFDVQAPTADRRMYGHGRVLPPGWRDIAQAKQSSYLLTTKAARRMRRDGFAAREAWLFLELKTSRWDGTERLASVVDDNACLAGIRALWTKAEPYLSTRAQIVRLGVALTDLCRADARQLDLFVTDDLERQKQERVSAAIDRLNGRYGQTVVSLGPWRPPPGGYAGGKIAYSRIPDHEDFW